MARYPFSIRVGAAFVLLAATCLAQADLKQEMTSEEFEASGLQKLSPEELQNLSDWIKQRAPVQSTLNDSPAPKANSSKGTPAVRSTAIATEPKAEAPPASPEARFGQEQIAKPKIADVPTQINARLKGEFRGWDGQTVFRLDNGQIWRQRVGGKYRSPKRTDPEVVVEKGRFGYYLKVVESGRSVAVKRIR